MFQSMIDTYFAGSAPAAVVAAAQFLAAVLVLIAIWRASRDRAAHAREMFGLMKKIEGLTAARRDRIAAEYDRMVESLSLRLPTAVASKTGELVFETEQRILARLAELEPNLKANPDAREKMEELIRSMEDLEGSMVTIAADAVHQVMSENRRDLFD